MSLLGTKGEQPLAKYLILFMVKGITTDLAFPLCHYATIGITADLLYPLTWEVIKCLEVDIGLKVLFITCDGASPNRRFFQLHANGNELVNFTINPYDENRSIFFISDAPHLLKTARNCFSNSSSHLMSRHLWCRGNNISWMHIVDLFTQYCTGLYRLCPKLTPNHVHLTSFNRMNVRLAAQVMSQTVAHALEQNYGNYVSETVHFIRIINKKFDIVNVKNLHEFQRERNDNLLHFVWKMILDLSG